MKILWLASWYPNPLFPYDGDFILRHARALAALTPVTVIYVAQWGVDLNVKKNEIIERENESVKEKIIFFRYRKTGFRWIDKFIYNLKFYSTYKKVIYQHFDKVGKPDIVHVHVPMKAGVIARWIFRKWGISYIVSEHSSLYDRAAPENFFTRSHLHRTTVKKIFNNASSVTNVSAAVGELLKKIFGLPEISVIHNTVDTNFFKYNGASPARFRFIHVSTLSFQKNIEGMLNVVSLLAKQRQDFEFVLVGPVSDQIQNLIVQNELQSVVKCTGEISYPKVATQMQHASALVLFSRYENFPCVLIEALCCGLPCISTNVGGISEAIDKSNGVLIPPGNENELSAAMNNMINEYHKFDRATISANAMKKYSYTAIGKQFMDLYKEILKTS